MEVAHTIRLVKGEAKIISDALAKHRNDLLETVHHCHGEDDGVAEQIQSVDMLIAYLAHHVTSDQQMSNQE